MKAKRKPTLANGLRKVQSAIYMDEHQYNALKKLSKRTLVPMQAYFRMGIDHVLATHKKELKS